MLEVVYDHVATPDASLDAVDNITVSAAGEIFVCEDGGNMEIGLITPEREVSPFLRFTGPAHPVEGEYKSEVCGVSFDPSGRRMYCTSQRAYPFSPSLPGRERSTRSAARSGCPPAVCPRARSGCRRASAGAAPSAALPASCA
jgi:secreted PhoX family phosphatase